MMRLMRWQMSCAHNTAANLTMNTSSRWRWYLAHDCFIQRIKSYMATLLTLVSSMILTEKYVQET